MVVVDNLSDNVAWYVSGFPASFECVCICSKYPTRSCALLKPRLSAQSTCTKKVACTTARYSTDPPITRRQCNGIRHTYVSSEVHFVMTSSVPLTALIRTINIFTVLTSASDAETKKRNVKVIGGGQHSSHMRGESTNTRADVRVPRLGES